MLRTPKNAGQTPAQLRQNIHKGEIQPLYYFFGTEDFEREELIQTLIQTVVEPASRAFNLDIFQSDDMDVSKAVMLSLTFPMMAKKRTVIMKRIERLPDAATRELLSLIQTPPPTTVLILTADKPDARKKLFSELKKNACCVEFKSLYDNEIPGWIQMRVKTLGRQMGSEAAHVLHQSVGNNLRELNGELEKLLIATSNNPITREDVTQVVTNTRGVTIFELADALGHRNLLRAQTLLKHLLEQGENPVGVLAFLIRHFGLLRKAYWFQNQKLPRAEMATHLKISPFFLGKYLDQVRNFNDGALWQICEALLQTDNRLKSRSRIQHQTLSELIYRICRMSPLDNSQETW